MRKFLTALSLLLAGYLVGMKKGVGDTTKMLLNAHFETCPDAPLVIKGEKATLTISKPKSNEEESE